MKIFQAALLAAAVTAIKLDDEIPEELAADLKADLGITDADLEALEKLPPKDKKKMIKEAAKGMGEEGLGDDLIKEMGLELADEGEGDKPAGDKKKPKKKGPPKEGEEGDMELPPLDELPPPCSEDDDECMAEVEKEIKKMLKEEGICSEDDDSCLGDAMIMIEEAVEGETADGLELGEDKKPKKKGPKGDDEGDMDLSGLDEDDLPSDLPSDLGSELPPLEFAQEIAELGESDLEDLADACSLDDEPCVEEAIKKMAGGEKPPKKEKKELGEDKKPKKKGPPKSEGGDEDDLPSDLDLSDLPSCGSDDECKEMVKEERRSSSSVRTRSPRRRVLPSLRATSMTSLAISTSMTSHLMSRTWSSSLARRRSPRRVRSSARRRSPRSSVRTRSPRAPSLPRKRAVSKARWLMPSSSTMPMALARSAPKRANSCSRMSDSAMMLPA